MNRLHVVWPDCNIAEWAYICLEVKKKKKGKLACHWKILPRHTFRQNPKCTQKISFCESSVWEKGKTPEPQSSALCKFWALLSACTSHKIYICAKTYSSDQRLLYLSICMWHFALAHKGKQDWVLFERVTLCGCKPGLKWVLKWV